MKQELGDESGNRYASPSVMSSPPRSVPFWTRIRLYFGGFSNQFGWIFFGFGMIFFWVFTLNCDPLAMVVFRGNLETSDGKVVEVNETSFSEGGGENRPGTPIFQYYYEFSKDDVVYNGISYSKGRKHNVEDSVKIEFPENRPERSRIVGLRTAPFSSFALLVLIFPLVGLGFITHGFLYGRKAVKLLRIGEYATGKLIRKEPTNTRINKQTVYNLHFEFQDQTGQTREATAATHETHHLEDDEREPLLYDPIDPSKATLLDHLPGKPGFDSHGQIVSEGTTTSILCLVIPLASMIGHSIAFITLILK